MPGEQPDLYEVLQVARGASHADIKKAYHKLALQLHPDKNPGDQEANAKFQSLQKVYAILGDAERRKLYDETGIADDDVAGGGSFSDLAAYFRAAFAKVTEADLDKFYDNYRGSSEEQEELLKLYAKFEGDMEQVFQHLVCSDPDLDSHRFKDSIQAAIGAGTASKHKRFAAWARRVEKQPRPKDPLKKRGGGGGGAACTALAEIRQKRAQESDAFYDQLAQKYGGAKQKQAGKKRKAPEEPSEEAFLATQQRLEGNRASKAGTSEAPGASQGKKAKGGAKAKSQGQGEEGAGAAKPAKGGKLSMKQAEGLGSPLARKKKGK